MVGRRSCSAWSLGAICGAWQGFWVAYVGIPGFIVTLAGYMFFRGANQFVGKSLTVPVPKDFQYLGAGYLPEWGPNTGMNNSTLLLGIVAIAVLIWMQLRQRQALIKINAEVPPLWVTITRIVLLAVVVGYLTWMFGTGRPGSSFPVPGLILVRAGDPLQLRHRTHGHRPPHLRRRRQPARGRAVRREHQDGSTSWS